MKLRQPILLATLAAFALTISGCGGSSNTPPPATVTVSLSGQPASLTPGATASITATVSNGTGVAWTVTCAAAPCGSFSPASTASGAATVYTAPASPTSVTITATTSSGTTAAASATISIAAPAITVTITNPPTSIAAGATANLTATVANDSQNKGVTWAVTCNSAAIGTCGSFNPTSTASAAATVYTAPLAIPPSGTVTITATSVTDTTKSASATITITAPGISVALNPTPPTSLIPGATSNLVAVVSNDSKNAGVTWSVTCGSSGACGSFSATATPSGTATIYSAPTAIPTNNTVTVTATSVTDTTKTASATITIANILANGTYVYHFYGYDSTGPSFFVGAFTVANGAITGGEQDFSDATIGYALDSISASGSSITTAGGNIQVVLATSNSKLGVGGIETLRGTVVSGSRVLISEFDTFGTATGSIDLQTSTANPSGGYAFAVSGLDAGTTQAAVGGILNISGSSLNINGSIFDVNVAGVVTQALTFSSGSVTAPDSFGRVTFSLTPAANTGIPEILLTGYIVSANQIMLVESQGSSTTLEDDLGGMALGQGSNTGNFSQASVTNKTYVFQGSGQDVNLFVNMAGTFVFGTGVSGTLALNDGTVFNVTNYSGATYAVNTNGRVSINGVSSPLSTTTPLGFQLYLDGNGNALELGVDAVEVTEGPAFLQSATGDFEGSYAIAGNGYLNLTGLPFWGAVGPVTVASDTVSGSTDYNYLGATPLSAQALTGTETSSSASLSLIGIDATAFTSSRTYTYFPIDSRRVFAVETDGNQIGLLTLEGISH
jgi:hypothetical protein